MKFISNKRYEELRAAEDAYIKYVMDRIEAGCFTYGDIEIINTGTSLSLRIRIGNTFQSVSVPFGQTGQITVVKFTEGSLVTVP